jgi:Zn finger protein HypA/HybF involved in hydrogenase expression
MHVMICPHCNSTHINIDKQFDIGYCDGCHKEFKVVNAKLVDVDGLIMNHMNTLKKESIDNK